MRAVSIFGPTVAHVFWVLTDPLWTSLTLQSFCLCHSCFAHSQRLESSPFFHLCVMPLGFYSRKVRARPKLAQGLQGTNITVTVSAQLSCPLFPCQNEAHTTFACSCSPVSHQCSVMRNKRHCFELLCRRKL